MKEWFSRLNTSYIFIGYSILLMGVMPIIVTPWRGEAFYDFKLLFTISITLSMVLVLLFSKLQLSYSILNIILLIYSSLLVISTVLSINIKVSIFGVNICREGLVSLITYLLIFYIFSKYYFWSEKSFNLILICTALISLYGILQYFKLLPEICSWKTGRDGVSLTTIGNENFVGSYCTLFLPITIWIFLKKGNFRYLLHTTLLLGLLLSSMTRSAWLAFCIYFPLLFVFNFRNRIVRKRWMALTVFLLIGVCFANFVTNSRLVDQAASIIADFVNVRNSNSGSGRIFIWKKALPTLKEHLILGTGPDTFGIVYSKYKLKYQLQFPKLHNEYYQIALTTGLPALAIYLVIVSIVLRRIVRKMKAEEGMRALFCSVVGYLIQAFFNISVISVAPVFWAFLGIGASEMQKNRVDKKQLTYGGVSNDT